MRLGIIANMRRPDAEATVVSVQQWAEKHNWPVLTSEIIDMVENPGAPAGILDDRIELLLALGGDGTILTAVRTAAPLKIPILGINLGRLGFLSAAPSGRAVEALQRVHDGDYLVEERLMLRVTEPGGDGESWAGLNDIVLDKGGIARIARFHVMLNDELVSQFDADGLIVATPTGSTAYSLSVGGPILMPDMRAYILAPISPHMLAHRPMVFGENDRLAVTVENSAGPIALTVDGQLTRKLTPGARIEITVAEEPARLVNFSDRSFLRTLREKLRWGIGPVAEE